MAHLFPNSIPDLLRSNISRELVMSIEEALDAGARQAYTAAKGMDQGHRPHAMGQLRHFHMNESFHRALEVSHAAPPPIRGNGVVAGRCGIFTLARFNISEQLWMNGRRSATRRYMAFANKAIEPLVQPELFEQYVPPSAAAVFFVACFSGSPNIQPESPVSIYIAVPNHDMRTWLFKEATDQFLRRYQPGVMQEDGVKPRLKQYKKQSNESTRS